MGPEDRLAALLAALDRLPRAARRALTVLLPLALLVALVASLAFAPKNRHDQRRPAGSGTSPPTRSTAPRTPTVHQRAKSTAPGDAAGRSSVAAAVAPARAFVESYVAFSYGRARLRAIRAADRALVRTLAGRRARVPPGQRKRRARVVALRVAPFSAGVARATAVVADGEVRYPLVFLLDRRRGGWLVTRIAD